MGAFKVVLEVGDPEAKRFEQFDVLVDTGATYTVLPASALNRLGVTLHRRSQFELADESIVEWELGRTWIRLNGNVGMTLVVFGDDGVDPILGAVTLEEFQLAPDPIRQVLFPIPALLKRAERT